MKILWIATKIPWPPRDGGRLLLHDTLRALAAAGHELTLVAPTLGDPAGAARAAEALRPWCRLLAVPARLRPRAVDVLRAQLLRRPWTLVRHRLPALRRRVAEVLRDERFDVVQAEQVQALESLPSLAAGRPVVWRAQNVESDLWSATGRQAGGWRRTLFALEARRLAHWEGRRVRETAATVALTREDAERLAALSGAGDKVHRIAAPSPASLPAAGQTLPGDPAVVILGSGGWLPNRRGARWFVEAAWPRVRRELPGARLHVFGDRLAARDPTVRVHPPPSDSRAAFAPGSILAVPLDVASGVRMKILEAWARGVPVVATPAAARGLAAEDGRHLLIAATGDGFAAQVRRLHGTPQLYEALVDAARERLRCEHGPERIAERWSALYETLTGVRSTTSPASGAADAETGPAAVEPSSASST